jgi:hypothetical protein
MKTLYLTKSGGTTDLSNYYTKAEVDANTYTQAQVQALRGDDRMINGSFRVAQRGTSFVSPTTNTFGLDRWKFTHITTGAYTASQIAITDPDLPFNVAYQLDVTTADTSIATTDISAYIYKVEGPDIADLGFGIASQTNQITLNFWHAHTKTGTHSVSFRNSANDRSYVAEYTQSVADTWEEATITITVDTSGTWLTAAGTTGLELAFCHMAGTTFTTTAGSWAAGNYLGSSSQVNNFDSTSNFYRLANVQLLPGDTALAYKLRTFVDELLLCQRYYELSYNYGTTAGTVTAVGMIVEYLTAIAVGAHIVGGDGRFNVTKALTPTVTVYSPSTGTSGQAYDYSAAGDVAVTVSLQGDNSFRYIFTVGSAGNVNAGLQWEAVAEL